jgi:hypothetical protein
MNKPYKSCNYCRAFSGISCLLNFKIELLPKDKWEAEASTKNRYTPIFVVKYKPAEKCPRPKTIKDYVEEFKKDEKNTYRNKK